MNKLIIGFDFDGTLYLSNSIKRKAFYLISSQYENGEKMIDKILNDNPFLNRYEIFKLFSKEYKIKFPNLKQIEPFELSTQYSKICFNHITKFTSPRKGIFEILNFLLDKKIGCYLISATPEYDLKKIVLNLDLNKYFKSVFGAPETKEEIITRIISNEEIPKKSFFYIGDNIKDFEVSQVVGCNFIPISDNEEFDKINQNVFNNLSDLIKIFESKI